MVKDYSGTLFDLHHGNVSEVYKDWPSPDVIISDGAYGVRGFHGDTTNVTDLVDWYKPHVLEWAKAAKKSTSLWFWNTEVGWATVHPLLLATGWEYVQLAIWDKGLAHIAGNIVGVPKSYSTYHIWKAHNTILSQHFWKEQTLWSDGYFACSIGNVSKETIEKYIESQG